MLTQEADDQAWAGQLGPAYRQADVALLLGKSKQAVSTDEHLLKLEMRDGALGYPVFQFKGSRQLAGIREVLAALGPAVETTLPISAAWR